MDRINKIIPEGWTSPKFGEVFDFLSTNSLSRNDLTFENDGIGIYNIHYGDIHATFKTPILDCQKTDLPQISKEDISKDKLVLLEEGDLIIADASEDYEGVGASVELENIGTKEITAGLHTFAARAKNGATVKGFRTYLLKHPWVANELKKIATGSKVYGVSKSNLTELELILPTDDEQRKIALILSKWDDLIERQTKLIEAKEQLKKGLIQKLLTARLRFPGSKKQWEYLEFGEIAKRSRQKFDPNSTREALPCIELEHLISGRGSITGYTLTSDLKSTKNKFDKGQVLFGKLRPYLKKYWYSQFEGACSSEIWVLTDANGKIDNQFLFYFIQQHRFIQAANATSGSKMPRSDWDFLSSTPFHIPPLNEQKVIVALLSNIDKEINLLTVELEKYYDQKKGLMRQLLTGKIKVNNEN